MKIIIRETIEKQKEIEVIFPYYYKHFIDSEYSTTTIYGKIEENKHTCIYENDDVDGEMGYELKIEQIHPKNMNSLSSYFSHEHKSKESEFLEAKSRLVSASNNV